MKAKEDIINDGVKQLTSMAEEMDDDINDDLKISFADFLRAVCDLLEALK